MDLAREVSFAGGVGDDEGIVSCDLSLEEPNRDALLGTHVLEPLGCVHRPAGSINACFTPRLQMKTAQNVPTQRCLQPET
jgi:hypothetical protein